MILRESLSLVVIGLVVGLFLTLAATQLVAARLFGVGSADPVSLGSAALALIAVSTLAALVPAHRASRIDAMSVLRCE